MYRFYICALALCGLLACQDSKEQQEIQTYAQYICGISLLQNKSTNPTDTCAQKGAKLRQLKIITGVSGDQVTAYLESVRDKPEKGLKLHDEILRLISEKTENIKK